MAEEQNIVVAKKLTAEKIKQLNIEQDLKKLKDQEQTISEKILKSVKQYSNELGDALNHEKNIGNVTDGLIKKSQSLATAFEKYKKDASDGTGDITKAYSELAKEMKKTQALGADSDQTKKLLNEIDALTKKTLDKFEFREKLFGGLKDVVGGIKDAFLSPLTSMLLMLPKIGKEIGKGFGDFVDVLQSLGGDLESTLEVFGKVASVQINFLKQGKI